MCLIVKELKEFRNAHYLNFCENEGEELHITTSRIYLPDVNLNAGPTLTFEMPRSLDETLFKRVVCLENKVAKTLKNLSPEMETNLSFECQKVLTSGTKNLIANIRSNYYGFHGDPKMYLKGNWKTIKLVNFKGEPITRDQLKDGNYQFIIRANMAYLGPHKNPEHIASLQLRISEIRFEPLKTIKPRPKRAAKRRCKPIEEDDDEPQAKKVQLSGDDDSTTTHC